MPRLTTVESVLLGMILIVLGASTEPVEAGDSAAAPGTYCLRNMKSLGLAFSVYLADNDEALPPARGWDKAIEPYVKLPILVCPSDKATAYAFHLGMGGKRLDEIAEAASTPLVFDSVLENVGMSATPAALPFPGRHEGRNAILYADLRAERVLPVR